MTKIKILLDEGSLLKASAAYLAFYQKSAFGGVRSRNGSWHIPPRIGWETRPYDEKIIYAKNVYDLKSIISTKYPDSEYIVEYL